MFRLVSRIPFLLIVVSSLCLCVSAVNVLAQGLPVAKPAAVGMDAGRLDRIEALVLADIAVKKLPGVVVLVGRKGKIVYRKAFGNRSLVPTFEPMTVDTIFDVASLTKPVATATSIMILIEQGKLQLNDTVGKFIPDLEDDQLKSVTIKQLLTHTSGLKPSFDLSEKWTGRDGMLAALKKEKLRNPPGTKFVYSDIGFMTLGEIVERVSGVSLDGFAAVSLFGRLNSVDSTYRRREGFRLSSPMLDPSEVIKAYELTRYAPTETVKGQRSYSGSNFSLEESVGNEMLRGDVHDPTAFRMGGVAGHAGLFSTADDLARYCQMILNGGVLSEPPAVAGGLTRNSKRPISVRQPPATAGGSDGRRILSAQTVAMMTRPYVVSETGATRGLGWDMNTTFSRNRGELFPLGSFGHTGFTGTSIWIDPTSETFVVFLSNRVHPDGKGDVGDLRAKVSTVVASAITDIPLEKWREAEARYYAAVNAQLAAFPKTPPPK
ncbi:MAG: serine hydrolase [Acidobacteriota bacterium]|nr:MAG: serine hydrolase [Acidobacteriota bacterium]